MKQLLAVCGDAGGASAVAPVLVMLRQDARVRVRPLAYRYAVEVFRRHGLAFETLDERTTPVQAADVFALAAPDVLLTGTTLGDVELEKRFLGAARDNRVPSLVVLDYWANYAARFADDAGRRAFVPDRIAVMDAQMRDEMTREGFDPSLLVVTGAPHWEGLDAVRDAFAPPKRAALRARAGANDNDLVVLFASQPLAASYGHNTSNPRFLGYSEHSVLCALVHVLDQIAQARDRRVVLLIRPHPREQAETYVHVRGEHITTRIIANGSAREWALAADLVTGMTTSLLIEACYLGCVALSLQPGLTGPDTLPTNRAGLSVPVYQAEQLRPTIERALFDDTFRANQQNKLQRCHPPRGATRRVCDLLYQMMEEPAS